MRRQVAGERVEVNNHARRCCRTWPPGLGPRSRESWVMTGNRSNRDGNRDTLRKISLGVAVACLTVALTACGGGGDDETAAVNPPANPPAGNQAPTISGTPTSQTMHGQQYTFTPTAS